MSQENEENKKTGGKPVVVYIMVLFIVAFLLMALSLAMHQRSNQANMDELKSSVQALENAQAAQGQVMELEKQLEKVLEENEALQKNLEEQEELRTAEQVERDSLASRAAALEKLNQLLQYYNARDYESCYPLLNEFACGLADSLPKEAPEGLTSPLEQFEAIHGKLHNGLTDWLAKHPDGKA